MPKTYEERMKWYQEARFGMFIHWGLYAIPARGEWVRNAERISVEDYQKYFDAFDPVDYDPKKWAKLAKEAGMKYAVLTTKHHDGFCLFDSAYTDYKATNTKAGRDLIREYVDAFRAEGLKVGFYYSLLDWHHEDYPHYGDMHHPMRDNEAFKGKEHNFDRYIEYMHNQVRELCTNYGKIDLMWFDFSYGDMRAEKWKATELINMVRSLQPDIIIDNRLEVHETKKHTASVDEKPVYAGDFDSPEQIIPPEGVTDVNGKPVPWEACITMNNHWGYCEYDRNYKNSTTVIRKLVECVSKGGNLLLNVGPDAKGNIPPESVKILKEVGEWMRLNSESITGCTKADIEKPDFGRATANGKNLYLHVYEQPVGCLAVKGIRMDDIKAVYMLATGAEVLPQVSWNSERFADDYTFLPMGEEPVFTYPLPDEKDTVVKVVLK